MHHSTAILAITIQLAVTCSACTSASAGFITQAGVAGQWADGSVLPATSDPFESIVQGTDSAATIAAAGGASGSASVSVLTNPGIHLSASVASTDQTEGYVTARGQWIDRILLNNPSSPPDDLLLHVNVHSIVDLSAVSPEGLLSYADVRFGVQTAAGLEEIVPQVQATGLASEVWIGLQPPSITGDPSIPPSGLSFFSGDSPTIQNFHASPFDELFQTYSSTVSWDTTFAIHYDETLGGYELNLVGAVGAVGIHGGNAYANLLNTIRLTDVTLMNGDAIEGGVTFDSGFSLAPAGVPEPSSFLTLSVGLLIGLFKVRRSCKSNAAVKQ